MISYKNSISVNIGLISGYFIIEACPIFTFMQCYIQNWLSLMLIMKTTAE